jgi:hypothetical protein
MVIRRADTRGSGSRSVSSSFDFCPVVLPTDAEPTSGSARRCGLDTRVMMSSGHIHCARPHGWSAGKTTTRRAAGAHHELAEERHEHVRGEVERVADDEREPDEAVRQRALDAAARDRQRAARGARPPQCTHIMRAMAAYGRASRPRRRALT